MESSDARDSAAQHTTETETPACQSCRSRKLRCSRDLPSCSRCSRLGVYCHYDYTRNKPGVKIGIIQTLTQRVESLEAELDAVKAQRQTPRGSPSPANPSQDVALIRGLVSSVLEEWLENHPLSHPSQGQSAGQIVEAEDNLPAEGNLPPGDSIAPVADYQPRKRRRLESGHQEGDALADQLPPDNLLNAILNAYFSVVHPFIPIIHESLFRSRLRDQTERPKLVVVLHAMMVCALRYVANERLAEEWLELHPDALHRSREFVILSGMDDLSVENAQALVMMAFVHIGDGDASKAWPVIGTLTRAVVYLGLHMEPEDDQPGEVCLGAFRRLPPARVWTEAEERRRVFWNVFLLDRFCSTITGWNASLSSEDVQVRLPCDGLYWVKEEPVITPFFNIWDYSMAKMGKSVSFLPSHFSSLADKEKDEAATAPASRRVSPAPPAPETGRVDISTIGSFAYCVEATESLNRVVKFFLQRPVNFESRKEFSAWITRFKELDLKLIHWKMFLPRRWKDSNISKEPAFVHMDPNLTLAHITHNTSMILLHQSIAYPRRNALDKLKQASNASAETCQLAASETANIVQKYLQYTPFVGLVNSQFAFCTFISARVMLVHAHIHHTDIPEGYNILLSSLQQMSLRWVSVNPRLKLNSETRNFAEGLQTQLQTLQARSETLSTMTASDYVAEVNCALGRPPPVASPAESQWIEERRAQQRHSIIPISARRSHYIDSNGLGGSTPSHTLHTPSSSSLQNERTRSERHSSIQSGTALRYAVPTFQSSVRGDASLNDLLPPTHPAAPLQDGFDQFAPLSNALLDPQYVDMDRIISFQDSFMC